MVATATIGAAFAGAVLVVVWVYRGESVSRGRVLAATALCLLVGSAGVYYAFFGCFLSLVAGASRWVRSCRPSSLALSAGLVGATTAAVATR